mmetsp:Transcript_25968/g.36273  ORF Transcript_25968/g.36273 Transcript_25968/m.36273 type:complete len:109 (-) Transcript_25968:418-744(-)
MQVWRIFEIIQNKGTVYTTQQQLFEIFRVMLTRESTGNKKVVARFLKKKYTQFFLKFNELLNSSYVVKRQSFKLLSEILQEALNFKVMLVIRIENYSLSTLLLSTWIG